MRYLILIFVVIQFGCTYQESKFTSEVEVVESFIEKAKYKNSGDLNEYFVPLTETQKQNGAEEFRNKLFNKIPTMLKGNTYKVQPFCQAKEELKLGEGISSEKVIVVVIEGRKNLYFKVQENKIESMSPVIKGSRIVGWF